MGNALWNVIILMVTVGYGDYYALTSTGRAMSIIACLYGSALISLVVLFLNDFLSMKPLEFRALYVLT